jgi:hypothetical protein
MRAFGFVPRPPPTTPETAEWGMPARQATIFEVTRSGTAITAHENILVLASTQGNRVTGRISRWLP